MLSQKGWTQTAIAQALGITQGAVSQWLKRAANEGVEGLKARPRRGPRSRLSPEQLRQLPGLLERGAEAFGFRGPVWTRGRIVGVIQQTFGVRYTPQRVGQLLRLLGWTLQKPKRKARQQDPAKVEAFLLPIGPISRQDVCPPRRNADPGGDGFDGVATRLHLETLPGYSPDLNPTEGLWSFLKRVELPNFACYDLSELRTELCKAIARVRHKRSLLQRFFQLPGLY